MTSGLAIGFFITSLTLVLLSRRPSTKSAVQKGLETELPAEEGTGMPAEGGPVIPKEPGTEGGK